MATAVYGNLQRKPMGSAQHVERRRVGKRDRELIVRYFVNAPAGVEPSAYAFQRMQGRYSETEIDGVMVAHVDLLNRLIAGCRVHAAGFTVLLREIETDTLADLAEAV